MFLAVALADDINPHMVHGVHVSRQATKVGAPEFDPYELDKSGSCKIFL